MANPPIKSGTVRVSLLPEWTDIVAQENQHIWSYVPFSKLTVEQASNLDDLQMLEGMLIARIKHGNELTYRVLTKPTVGYVHYLEFLEDGVRQTKKGQIIRLPEGIKKVTSHSQAEICHTAVAPSMFRTLFNFDLGRKDGAAENNQRCLFLHGLDHFLDHNKDTFDPFDL